MGCYNAVSEANVIFTEKIVLSQVAVSYARQVVVVPLELCGFEFGLTDIFLFNSGPDAIALTYENWGRDEPNDHNGVTEECIEYRPKAGWNDIICKQDRRFICEQHPTYNPKPLKVNIFLTNEILPQLLSSEIMYLNPVVSVFHISH